MSLTAQGSINKQRTYRRVAGQNIVSSFRRMPTRNNSPEAIRRKFLFGFKRLAVSVIMGEPFPLFWQGRDGVTYWTPFVLATEIGPDWLRRLMTTEFDDKIDSSVLPAIDWQAPDIARVDWNFQERFCAFGRVRNARSMLYAFPSGITRQLDAWQVAVSVRWFIYSISGSGNFFLWPLGVDIAATYNIIGSFFFPDPPPQTPSKRMHVVIPRS